MQSQFRKSGWIFSVILLLIAILAQAQSQSQAPFANFSNSATGGGYLEKLVRGEATMEGVLQVHCLSQSVLHPHIPKRLHLMDSSLCPKGFQPGVFFFGQQRNLRAVHPFGAIPVKDLYQESIFAILAVGVDFSSERFSHILQIKVDSKRAWLFAKPYGGLNKNLASFEATPETQRIWSRKTQEEMAHIKWEKVASFDSVQMQKNLQEVQGYLADRIISEDGNKLKCFQFSWNLDLKRIAPAILNFQIFDSYWVPELSGSYGNKTSLDLSPRGAFHFSSDWQMSYPSTCGS